MKSGAAVTERVVYGWALSLPQLAISVQICAQMKRCRVGCNVTLSKARRAHVGSCVRVANSDSDRQGKAYRHEKTSRQN